MTAVIEIGTHSVKCLRGSRDRVVITRLGGSGTVEPAAAARTLRVVRRFLREGPAVIVATHGLRVAGNVRDILKRWDLDVWILSEHEEALFSYRGATSGLGPGPFLTVDVGGGSTEVSADCFGTSLCLGAATLTREFCPTHPITPRALKALERHIRRALKTVPWKSLRGRTLVAVGGTAVTAAQMSLPTVYRLSRFHGYPLPVEQLQRWTRILSAMSIEDRLNIPRLDRGRADVMPAGLSILVSAAELARVRAVTISTRGVRHGVALSLEK